MNNALKYKFSDFTTANFRKLKIGKLKILLRKRN